MFATKDVYQRNKLTSYTVTSSDKLMSQKMRPSENSEVDPELEKYNMEIISKLYAEFKSHVMKYRGDKFDKDMHDHIFNSNVYLGEDAKKYGLIDDIGDE